MARYISRASAFKKTVRKPVITLVNTPQGPEQKVTEDAIIAFFRQAGTTPWEAEQALKRFQFLGLGEHENPLHRISAYDTDEQANLFNWSPELKAHVEAILDAGQGPDYFRCDKPKLAPPWPTYDSTDARKIPSLVEQLGIDPEYAVAYERENANREPVISALSGDQPSVAETEDVVVKA